MLWLFSAVIAQAAEYRMQRLELLDGYICSQAMAVNDSGLIAGRAKTASGVWVAVKWDANGIMSPVDYIYPGGNSGVSDINSNALMIGYAHDAMSQMHSTQWYDDGSIKEAVKPLQASGCWGTSINDLGDVAEYYYKDQNSFARVRKSDGSITALQDLTGYSKSYTNELNDSGQVVGCCMNPQSYRQAVRWDADGHITPLSSLDGSVSKFSDALGINRYGVVAGIVKDSNNINHACVWHADGSIADLCSPAALFAEAYAINDLGQVTGTVYEMINGIETANIVIWEPDRSVSVIHSNKKTSWGGGFGAFAINNNGVVVGSVVDNEFATPDDLRAVVWTPVPEPSSIAVLAAGFAGFGAFLGRRRTT